jgi:hypothetical protein
MKKILILSYDKLFHYSRVKNIWNIYIYIYILIYKYKINNIKYKIL